MNAKKHMFLGESKADMVKQYMFFFGLNKAEKFFMIYEKFILGGPIRWPHEKQITNKRRPPASMLIINVFASPRFRHYGLTLTRKKGISNDSKVRRPRLTGENAL